MPRKAHRKSRKGCIECKRRHVKCDEKRPICTNCTVSERRCEYAELFRGTFVAGPSPTSASRASTTTTSTSTTTPTPTIVSPSPHPYPPTFPADPPANLLHFSLFHHLYTETIPSLDEGSIAKTLAPELAPTIFTTSYLLNEILALSALHKSTTQTCPAQRSLYRHHASQLQTHALTDFNTTTDTGHLTVTAETCVPLFLFACYLAMHMLCDTLVFRDTNDFDAFLDRFVTHLGLYRGVRAITGQSWSLLRESSLRTHLLMTEGRFSRPDPHALGPECQRLMQRIEAARLGPEITACYRQAVQALQTAISAVGDDGSSTGASSWPVLVGGEYMDLVVARRPEALVVLAHYAVLLHRGRSTGSGKENMQGSQDKSLRKADDVVIRA
ncbi:hypothetical protein FE257_008003 [Aspergillus nanangensis]|uniref:Zn(2)-C6 fungal-type domain-containing protein n=1 Tax=Aspergillus nanangensis TaxID=2582783 RepID=A0AAD4CM55_ASPNN|nr:hypothetical protein FE257_008003 [Aspergillus nanangensis]